MARTLLFIALYVAIAYTGGYAWMQVHRKSRIDISDLTNSVKSVWSNFHASENNRFYRWRADDGTWHYGAEPPTQVELTHTGDVDRIEGYRETILRTVVEIFPELDLAVNRQKEIEDKVKSAL